MKGRTRIWSIIWVWMLALPLAFVVACSSDDDDDDDSTGGLPTLNLTEDQERILGNWKNEVQGYDADCEVAVTEYYEMDFQGSGAYMLLYKQTSDDSDVTCNKEDEENGTYYLGEVSDSEQQEWATAFPQIEVKLDYKLTLKKMSDTEVGFVQFLDPKDQGGLTVLRLFYYEDGEKTWGDLIKSKE